MTTLKARFDGHVLIPTQPVELPIGPELEIHIEEAEISVYPLAALADWAEQLPDNSASPTDGAAQHDHYLYGTAKRS